MTALSAVDEACLQRFWAKVRLKPGPSARWPKRAKPDCWLWRGAKSRGGRHTKVQKNTYGNFRVGGKFWRAHRFAWVMICGRELDEGLTLDHKVCEYTLCVNPSHLEPATRGANAARANRRRGLKWVKARRIST